VCELELKIASTYELGMFIAGSMELVLLAQELYGILLVSIISGTGAATCTVAVVAQCTGR
jgi:hypothetical protein